MVQSRLGPELPATGLSRVKIRLYGLYQLYLRVRRPLTIGVKAAVFNASGEILLVKHSYQEGWHLPGGGVKKGENLAAAARRELAEETGVIAKSERLFSAYSNLNPYRNDHIILFLIEEWQSDRMPPSARWEIEEARFFHPDSLPEDVTRPTRDRLLELTGKKARSLDW